MTRYVDGFVIPVPKKKLATYLRMARRAAAIWREHGALDFKECTAEQLDPGAGLPFPRGIRARPGETIVFSWIGYESRAHRDRVNANVMRDPRMTELCRPDALPFDARRMLWGGFKVSVA